MSRQRSLPTISQLETNKQGVLLDLWDVGLGSLIFWGHSQISNLDLPGSKGRQGWFQGSTCDPSDAQFFRGVDPPES